MAATFYQVFIFHQMIALQNHEKKFFSSKKLLSIEIFKPLYFHLPLFFPISHCFRGWSKKRLKVNDIDNIFCLIYWEKNKVWWNWNSAHWIELNKEHFLQNNHAEIVHQNLAPDSSLILLNNPKQPLHARNSFRNKVFWKRIIKSLKKFTFIFSFKPSPF